MFSRAPAFLLSHVIEGYRIISRDTGLPERIEEKDGYTPIEACLERSSRAPSAQRALHCVCREADVFKGEQQSNSSTEDVRQGLREAGAAATAAAGLFWPMQSRRAERPRVKGRLALSAKARMNVPAATRDRSAVCFSICRRQSATCRSDSSVFFRSRWKGKQKQKTSQPFTRL